MATGSTSAPPDGWSLINGLWGTNAYSLASVGAVSGIGAGGVRLVTGTLLSNWISLDVSQSNASYVATARYTVASISNTPTINFVLYKADKATVVSTTTLVNQTLAGTYGLISGQSDVSRELKPTSSGVNTTPYGRWEITGSGTGSSDIQFTHLERIRPSMILAGATSGSIAASTFTNLPWTETVGNEEGFTSPKIVLRRAGKYLFTVNIQYAPATGSFAAGNIIQTQIYSVVAGPPVVSTAASPPIYHYVPATGETQPQVSFSQLVDVPQMAIGGGAYTPYLIVGVTHNSATTLKTIPANCSLGVVLVN